MALAAPAALASGEISENQADPCIARAPFAVARAGSGAVNSEPLASRRRALRKKNRFPQTPLRRVRTAAPLKRCSLHAHGGQPEGALRRVRTYLATAAKLLQSASVSELTPARLRAWARETATRDTSASRVRQQYAAVRFLFRRTLGRPEVVAFLSCRAGARRLPVVLSTSEVMRLLGALRSPVFRTMFLTMYATGLRLSEACALKVEDLDVERGVIRVSGAKGGHERLVTLGARLAGVLRDYAGVMRPAPPWLFTSRRGRPVHAEVARRALARAANDAGLPKRVTPHVLRHTFATHSLERGTELPVIQRLLGHRSPGSTARYVHVSSAAVASARTPIDDDGFVL